MEGYGVAGACQVWSWQVSPQADSRAIKKTTKADQALVRAQGYQKGLGLARVETNAI